MSLICPICKSPAQEVDRVGGATGFHCTEHGTFRVAGMVLDYTREQWEAALAKAKLRTKPGEWPVIRSYDF